MLPKQEDWKTFYDAMKRRSGLDLYKYKAQQLQRRILSMMEARKVDNLSDFWKWLDSSPENITWFMDKLAINVSELFRNPEKWLEMRHKVIPDLLSRSNGLKIWSAGCSYGAEAYSMATLLEAHFPGRHQIVGSDIDQAALSQAREGRFTDADMRCVPAEYKLKYFLQSGSEWLARPELKKYVSFKTGNLLEDRFDGGFDMIMCRNVVIYFTDDAKNQLYEKFVAALKPNGILFVGSTERVFTYKELGLETKLPFFYTKGSNGENKWRNAS